MKKALSISVIVIMVIIGCSKSDNGTNNNVTTVDCSNMATSWSANVSPIIQTYCATNSGCHGTGSINGPGPLTTYTQVYNNRTAIRSAVASGLMPKNGSLSASQKNTILCWIDNGASEN